MDTLEIERRASKLENVTSLKHAQTNYYYRDKEVFPGAIRRKGQHMIAKASARFVRANPTKARWVADLIRGRNVGEALQILKYTNKRPAKVISKVLDSAIANAQENRKADVDSLFVSGIYVDQGSVFKRFRARAMGRAARILKRTSHITVMLDQR